MKLSQVNVLPILIGLGAGLITGSITIGVVTVFVLWVIGAIASGLSK